MTSRSLITYTLAGASCLIPVEAIVEIYRVVAFTPFENAPKRVIGYAAFRGKPIFGIDLQDIFSEDGHRYDSDASLVVTRSGDILIGMLVDRIGEIIRIDESFEVPREQASIEANARVIRKVYSIDDTTHFEFDLIHLFTDAERLRLDEYSSSIEGSLEGLQT